MIRGLSNSELCEILQETRAEVMALLRIELDAEDIPGVHGASKVRPTGDRRAILCPVALEVIGVQEIEPRIRAKLFEQPVAGYRPHVVPSHVWKRKTFCGRHRPEA